MLSIIVHAQNDWTWTEVSSMPIKTSNNAVTEAIVNNKRHVYSFGGISDSLKPSEIHQRVFKYITNEDAWYEMPSLPDTLGKISNHANFVNDKVYIIGGKHILEDSSEIVSNKVHIYDPLNDVFESDGANLPIAVADHVQAVWKDSLIYVITGKSSTGNIADVQIYNPLEDTWTLGTPLPDDESFLRVGASGYILNDTIYYFGGATDTLNPNAKNHLLKGVIDHNNPSLIDWTFLNFNLGSSIYRGACSGFGNTVFWIGGSDESYSFAPIDTINNENISANEKIMMIDLKGNTQTNSYHPLNNIMDLNGIANLGGGNWIIAGGIDSTQIASDRVFLLHNPKLSSIETAFNPPHFEVIDKGDYFLINTENVGEIHVYTIAGSRIYSTDKHLADLKIEKYLLSRGVLLFIYDDDINIPLTIKKVNPN